MYILCDLKGQCLNHDHIAHVYEYIQAEFSKLRQQVGANFRAMPHAVAIASCYRRVGIFSGGVGIFSGDWS